MKNSISLCASLFIIIIFSLLSITKASSEKIVIPPILPLLLDGPTDSCPNDPIKSKPEICGCGISDVDNNQDGIMDCLLQPGATNIRQFLVQSDGSRSLGNSSLAFNTTRDQGSKVVYFDSSSGNNATADVYWWNGSNIVDSAGRTSNPDNGEIYGSDVLNPNIAAIKPFFNMITSGDNRLRTQMSNGGPNGWRFSGLAGGYPDWFLFRRGKVHTDFDMRFAGGRSEGEPMVVAAYGPISHGRAIMEPKKITNANPFTGHNWGEAQSWMHQVLYSLEIRAHYGYLGTHTADTYAVGGGPVTAFIEDCYWPTLDQGVISYPPHKTTIRRSIVSNAFDPESHNQGYFTSKFQSKVNFDEVIFYKNGYKNNPLTNPDPKRDIFSRNVYQGGGAQMGHTYRNVISADGASGGPQMRFGGLMENSLIIEGYFYSSTFSNSPVNNWMENNNQSGQSAIVRNNVQLIYGYPTENDPDTNGNSDTRSQPFWGYALEGASFGSLIEGNIISGAMLRDELSNGNRLGANGLSVVLESDEYKNGVFYSQKDNTIRNNIAYGVSQGLRLKGNAQGVSNVKIDGNVFVSDNGVAIDAENAVSTSQVLVSNNKFYTNNSLVSAPWMGSGNATNPYDSAQSAESWLDPDRTLKRYVTEVLNLTLMDWSDNPLLDPIAKQIRINGNEEYDPAGIKSFMAVATNMRYGGSDPIPNSGKPNIVGDYPWDSRFTATAVVNWIRAGFNMPPVN